MRHNTGRGVRLRPRRRPQAPLGIGATPAFSPDGTQIVFSLGRGKVRGTSKAASTSWLPMGRTAARSSAGIKRRDSRLATLSRGACPPAPGLPTHVKRRKAPPTLSAKVGPGFTIAIRNKAGRRVKKLAEGTYSARINDSSKRHSLHVSGRESSIPGPASQRVRPFSADLAAGAREVSLLLRRPSGKDARPVQRGRRSSRRIPPLTKARAQARARPPLQLRPPASRRCRSGRAHPRRSVLPLDPRDRE